MTIKSLFIALCFAVITPMAQAITLEQVQQHLIEQKVIRAHFEQIRTIKSIPQPLKSHGKMIVAKDTGIIWQQEQPFAMQLTLKKDRMVQQMAGQPAQVITAESNPQMFQFNHLLTALFTADRATLEKNFQIDFNGQNDQHWQLNLVPTSTPLDKIFASIVIKGGKFIDAVQLNDKQGDVTAITFSQQQTTPEKLTSEEQHSFEIE